MPNLTFNAIDVETANRNRASICQIGMAQVHAGKITKTLTILVNPEEPFEPFNTNLHGIDEHTIRNAATMPGAYAEILRLIDGTTIVSHTEFDRQALEKATTKYRLHPPKVRWLDSARIARQAWPQKYAKGGPSLKQITADLGIEFKHHDAGEDARAAAEILLHTHNHTGLDVDDWLDQANPERDTAPLPKTGPADSQPSPPEQRTERTQKTPIPPKQPSPIGLLAKILKLEQDKRFNDSAVIGGLDEFLQQRAGAIREELGSSGIHRILLTIPYEDLSEEERSWWVGQWQEIMDRMTTRKSRDRNRGQQ